MTQLERIAQTILAGDALGARSLVRDWFGRGAALDAEPHPQTSDLRILALTAALAELFAERLGQPAPSWTSEIGAAPEALYLLRSALTMRRLREACEAESPAPLRRRRIFAPSNYLVFA